MRKEIKIAWSSPDEGLALSYLSSNHRSLVAEAIKKLIDNNNPVIIVKGGTIIWVNAHVMV